MENKEESKPTWELVFTPTVALMNRLRYAFKFILIGVLFLAPLGAITYLQYSSTTKDIEFNRKEVIGVSFIDPARDMLFSVQRHRVLSAALASGDSGLRSDLDKTAADVNQRVGEVDAVDSRYGALLKTTRRWGDAKAAWDRIRGGRFGSPAEAEEAHGALTAILLDLILNQAANNSNLILDPDLDSYWLMDAYTGKLPALSDQLGRGAALGLIIPPDAAGKEERAVELSGYYKLMQGTMGDIDAVNMATAFREVRNFSQSSTLVPTLRDPLLGARDAVGGAANELRRSYLGAAAAPTAETHRRATQATLEALRQAYTFSSKVGPELSKLCQLRVDRYTQQRTLGLAVSAAATLTLLFLFVGFYISVRRAVDAVRVGSRKMISGTKESFQLETKDELGEVAGLFNEINTALVEARDLKDKVQNENSLLQADIMQMLQVVSDASDGNLTVRAQTTEGALGNVADAFNQLMESLGGLLSGVQKQIDETNQAVRTIESASQSVEDGAANQVRQIDGAAQVIRRVSDETTKVSTNAANAANATKRTEQSASDGSEAVQSVVQGMSTLRSSVQSGAKRVKSLGDRSMEITGFVSTISRISEQTNMLALNAAIEAARAGEHGRGFSVVAEEVRKLAERTASATQEIDRLVRAIQLETNETVAAIEQQTRIVEQQSSAVARCGEALERIRQVSTESATLVADISKLAKGQVENVQVITKVTEQVSSIARETQSGVQDTNQTVKNLLQLSDQLSSSMSRFRVA